MTKLNKDTFRTVKKYELGAIQNLLFELQIWQHERDTHWVLMMYGESVREHVKVDDQTAAMLIRNTDVEDN